ncbi:SOS response-associated peptidase [Chroococcus sp. FPU101]|uniref:SOS response-associated peptidase n=1 Tax=Chroococcus sp. FPU101 TaxID=1974212 RepID=UPI001A8D4202|nr:SOS response-associated peptidase [Chroococcus sp. FPU101]GFE72271.1 hypothetical protein CFPU101_48810 [Chroococcus sp. FPU101]
MCGRFTLRQTPEEIAVSFELSAIDEQILTPQYNIAPTKAVAAITLNAKSSQRQLKGLRWGLIPSWAKDDKIGYRLINARAETLSEKASFRNAFKNRRCLILADGFYEWQKTEKQKQPYYFQLRDKKPFAFAGLWETWQPPDGEMIASCTIITTEANELVKPIHNRMPVILSPDAYDQWLDPKVKQPEILTPLLKPYDEQAMETYSVSHAVNRPSHNQPNCIEPLSKKV